MNFVIAMDSFKGTISNIHACETVKAAIVEVLPKAKTTIIPVADGGEGTVESYFIAFGGTKGGADKRRVEVIGPQFHPVVAEYLILPDGTAVIEMASSSGLTLLKTPGDPINTTTLGTGQLIRDALDMGCRRFIIGLGGSATNDGGIGALTALGVLFTDSNGMTIPPTGGGLSKLVAIDTTGIPKALKDSEIIIACDVDNLLCGPQGASFVYGKQKGAMDKDLAILDKNLENFAKVVLDFNGKDILTVKGGGAAGGMCAGLHGLLEVKIQSGIDLFLETVNFNKIIKRADYIITGEGKLDSQTTKGKVVKGISLYGKKYKKAVIAISGQLELGYQELYKSGLTCAFSTLQEFDPQADFDAIKKDACKNLFSTTTNVCRLLAVK